MRVVAGHVTATTHMGLCFSFVGICCVGGGGGKSHVVELRVN